MLVRSYCIFVANFIRMRLFVLILWLNELTKRVLLNHLEAWSLSAKPSHGHRFDSAGELLRSMISGFAGLWRAFHDKFGPS